MDKVDLQEKCDYKMSLDKLQFVTNDSSRWQAFAYAITELESLSYGAHLSRTI